MARSEDVIQGAANEALSHSDFSAGRIVERSGHSEIARDALLARHEFGSDEARQIINALDQLRAVRAEAHSSAEPQRRQDAKDFKAETASYILYNELTKAPLS